MAFEICALMPNERCNAFGIWKISCDYVEWPSECSSSTHQIGDS